MKRSNRQTHGHIKVVKGKRTTTPEYRAWQNMRQRCRDPKSKDYPDYGARGIKVTKRWDKFDNFLADMGNHPGKGYSLDRKNNDGNYCKSNCRWATAVQQRKNRRVAKTEIVHEGKPLSWWARLWNITRQGARYRVLKMPVLPS